MNQIVKQIRYGYIKAANFTIDQRNHDWKKNTIDMYSTHNEGKSVNAKKFIITLKNKIYKYMTSISKNVYIDKLDDAVHKYNNTYHITIRMKPIDVRSNSYIDSSKQINDDDSNIKTSQHKNILAIGYTPN